MRKIIGFHKWQEKKGQAGKKFVKVIVIDDYGYLKINPVWEDVPPKNIYHITIAIFRKTFDFVYPVFKR